MAYKGRKRIKSRRQNRKIFARGARLNKKNKPTTSMRGGRRL